MLSQSKSTIARQGALGHEPQRIRIGQAEVHLGAERLWYQNEERHVSPKAFALLRAFMQAPGHLLTRKTLFEQVWTNQVVTDAVLTQTLLGLRRALGCQGDVIKTVPRRGYLLAITPVPLPDPRQTDSDVDANTHSSIDTCSQAMPTPQVPSYLELVNSAQPRARWRNLRLWSVAAVLGLGLLVSLMRAGGGVLPIKHLILTVDAPDVGLAQAFRALVKAELNPAMQVHLPGELIAKASDQHSDTLSISLTPDPHEPNKLQWRWLFSNPSVQRDGEAEATVERLRASIRQQFETVFKLSDDSLERAIPTQAFELYVRGNATQVSGQLLKAQSLFSQALELSPTNTILLSSAATTAENRGEMRAAAMYWNQLAQTKINSAEKHYARFKVALLNNDFAAALKILPTASMPTAEAAQQRIALQIQLGKFDEASKLLQVAKLDPSFDPGRIAHHEGWLLMKQRQYPEAKAAYVKALALPNLSNQWRAVLSSRLASAEYRMGNFKAAQSRLQDALENFTPGVTIDEQFSARRMIFNIRQLSHKSCYQGREIDTLKTIAVEQIGTVRAVAGYYSALAMANLNCDKIPEAVDTLTKIVEITEGKEALANQFARNNRARLNLYLGKRADALADIKAIASSGHNFLTQEELDFLRVRMGEPISSHWVKHCFDAVRDPQAQKRQQLAQQCLQQTNTIYAKGTVPYEVVRYIAKGEPKVLPKRLLSALKLADLAEREWPDYCVAARRDCATALASR
jgi:DNA-binding winged helix-turn-helix (wHTH) protein/tetratricopeptide (TPR) repeat protein